MDFGLVSLRYQTPDLDQSSVWTHGASVEFVMLRQYSALARTHTHTNMRGDGCGDELDGGSFHRAYIKYLTILHANLNKADIHMCVCDSYTNKF